MRGARAREMHEVVLPFSGGTTFFPWYAIKFTSGICSTVQCGRHADFEYGVSSLSHDYSFESMRPEQIAGWMLRHLDTPIQ